MFFSGLRWEVRPHSNRLGRPWSEDNVWLDRHGLHLRVSCRNGQWRAGSVRTEETLGYGRYIFYLNSRYDLFDKNLVLGLFTYESDNREIDIELSRWGGGYPNSLFLVQSSKPPKRFNAQLTGSSTTHRFKWQKGRVDFQSIHGHYRNAPSGHLIAEHSVTENVHHSHKERVHINFWMYKGVPPKRDTEVVIKGFEFIPL